jgi:glycosyltransferase involved in cell wall biosynthesis
MVSLPECDDNLNLRDQLGIDKNAIVFGRYGGNAEFNITYVQHAVRDYANANMDVYFLFMNTDVFYVHPRIIYLEANHDLEYKVKFINSCDAMIHARDMGETFGLSIAEFSSRNKPVITCNCGDTEHIQILGDKAVVYNSYESLLGIFMNIRQIIASREDWNAYTAYSPENVMNQFAKLISDNQIR